MPCVGNHEYLDRGPWLYRSIFALPANGPAGVAPDLVYSFEVGDAFIAVLDSTLAVTDPAQARLQADWLDDRLARTRRAWKLVMFHHPVYASHASRESPALRDAWVPVFDRHHVDLVLQGHDHAYLRTYPMRGEPPRRFAGRGDGLRRLGLGRQVLRPGPARVHRGRLHGRLDLPDDRPDRAPEPPGLPVVRRRRAGAGRVRDRQTEGGPERWPAGRREEVEALE